MRTLSLPDMRGNAGKVLAVAADEENTEWVTGGGGGGGITSLTQSTGITLTPNPITSTGTIKANLSTGISGGQYAYGDTDPGGYLYLSSTTDVVKGFIYFGDNFNVAFDETLEYFGFGNGAPNCRVQVSDDADATTGFAQLEVTGLTTAKRLQLGFDTTRNVGFIQATQTGVGNKNLLLQAVGGNVGIGTLSPTSKLHIEASLGTNYINLEDTATGDIVNIYLQTPVGSGPDLKIDANRIVFDGITRYISATSEYAAGIDWGMVGNQMGVAGIGTLFLQTSVANIDILRGGYNQTTFLNAYTGFDILMQDGTSGNGNGKVGIHQSTPTAWLHVGAGTAAFAPFALTAGTNTSTAVAGSLEYNGTNLFFTRAGTTRENVLVAVDGVAAPSTTATPAFTSYYGTNTIALGNPNRWISVNILGTVYKIPMYN